MSLLVCPEQWSSTLFLFILFFLQKSSRNCKFFGFLASSTHLSSAQQWLYDVETQLHYSVRTTDGHKHINILQNIWFYIVVSLNQQRPTSKKNNRSRAVGNVIPMVQRECFLYKYINILFYLLLLAPHVFTTFGTLRILLYAEHVCISFRIIKQCFWRGSLLESLRFHHLVIPSLLCKHSTD